MPDNIQVLHDLDAGIYIKKVNAALKDAGIAAITTGKQSQVTLTLKFDRIDDSRQVSVTHKLGTVLPHDTGKTTDEDTKKTPIHVHSTGALSVFSEDQIGFKFTNPTSEEKT